MVSEIEAYPNRIQLPWGFEYGVGVYKMQNPQITEIQVRMDCNGCVQKIKKALNRIHGIYDFNVDFSQQKLRIVGKADPEKIVKAIRKARKSATICAQVEPVDLASQRAASVPRENLSASDAQNAHPPEAAPLKEPPRDPEPPQPTKVTTSILASDQPISPSEPKVTGKDPEPPQPTDVTTSTLASESTAQPISPSEPKATGKDPEPPQPTEATTSTIASESTAQPISSSEHKVSEVCVIYPRPPEYEYGYIQSHGGCSRNYDKIPAFRVEQHTPIYTIHKLNAYQPSPYITNYEHIQPLQQGINHGRIHNYFENYQHSNGNVSFSSMFSDENPNACRII